MDDARSITTLRNGATLLAIVLASGEVLRTHDIALSHAEFVRRSFGTLPEGAWVGTVRKADNLVTVLNSRTFYGNQLPAPERVAQAIRAVFE